MPQEDGEGQPELRREPRQTQEPTRNSLRGERLEQEGPRRMKRRTGNLERQTEASRKGTVHQAENHEQPARNPGNRHKGAQTTDRNLDRESRLQMSQPEGATGAGEPKNNPLTEHGGRRGGKGRTPEDHQPTNKPCEREPPSVEWPHST